MRRRRLLRAVGAGAAVLGVAMVLTPAITQELWTQGLLVPVLACGLLSLYVITSIALNG